MATTFDTESAQFVGKPKRFNPVTGELIDDDGLGTGQPTPTAAGTPTFETQTQQFAGPAVAEPLPTMEPTGSVTGPPTGTFKPAMEPTGKVTGAPTKPFAAKQKPFTPKDKTEEFAPKDKVEAFEPKDKAEAFEPKDKQEEFQPKDKQEEQPQQPPQIPTTPPTGPEGIHEGAVNPELPQNDAEANVRQKQADLARQKQAELDALGSPDTPAKLQARQAAEDRYRAQESELADQWRLLVLQRGQALVPPPPKAPGGVPTAADLASRTPSFAVPPTQPQPTAGAINIMGGYAGPEPGTAVPAVPPKRYVLRKDAQGNIVQQEVWDPTETYRPPQAPGGVPTPEQLANLPSAQVPGQIEGPALTDTQQRWQARVAQAKTEENQRYVPAPGILQQDPQQAQEQPNLPVTDPNYKFAFPEQDRVQALINQFGHSQEELRRAYSKLSPELRQTLGPLYLQAIDQVGQWNLANPDQAAASAGLRGVGDAFRTAGGFALGLLQAPGIIPQAAKAGINAAQLWDVVNTLRQGQALSAQQSAVLRTFLSSIESGHHDTQQAIRDVWDTYMQGQNLITGQKGTPDQMTWAQINHLPPDERMRYTQAKMESLAQREDDEAKRAQGAMTSAGRGVYKRWTGADAPTLDDLAKKGVHPDPEAIAGGRFVTGFLEQAPLFAAAEELGVGGVLSKVVGRGFETSGELLADLNKASKEGIPIKNPFTGKQVELFGKKLRIPGAEEAVPEATRKAAELNAKAVEHAVVSAVTGGAAAGIPFWVYPGGKWNIPVRAAGWLGERFGKMLTTGFRERFTDPVAKLLMDHGAEMADPTADSALAANGPGGALIRPVSAAAKGALYALPYTAGPKSPEEIGQILGTGAMMAGAPEVPGAARDASMASLFFRDPAQYKSMGFGPVDYGTTHFGENFDAAHNARVGSMEQWQKDTINDSRGLMPGVEQYHVGNQDYQGIIGRAQQNGWLPEGNLKSRAFNILKDPNTGQALIIVNADAGGGLNVLHHEIGHSIYRTLAPDQQLAFKNAAFQFNHPDALTQWYFGNLTGRPIRYSDLPDQAGIDNGTQGYLPGLKGYTKEHFVEEMGAETVAALLRGKPLGSFIRDPSLLRRAQFALGSVMENLGIHMAPHEAQTILGVKPGVAQMKIMDKALRDYLKRNPISARPPGGGGGGPGPKPRPRGRQTAATPQPQPQPAPRPTPPPPKGPAPKVTNNQPEIGGGPTGAPQSAIDDAVKGLQSLKFPKRQAQQMVANASGQTAAELLRNALKNHQIAKGYIQVPRGPEEVQQAQAPTPAPHPLEPYRRMKTGELGENALEGDQQAVQALIERHGANWLQHLEKEAPEVAAEYRRKYPEQAAEQDQRIKAAEAPTPEPEKPAWIGEQDPEKIRQQAIDEANKRVGFMPMAGEKALKYPEAEKGKRLFMSPLHGKKQFEIDDRDMQWVPAPPGAPEQNMLDYNWTHRVGGVSKLGEVIDHPELFRNYPDLWNVNVEMRPEYRASGSWEPRQLDNQGVMQPERIILRAMNKGTLAHEIQHGVQWRENWPLGSSPQKTVLEMNRDQAITDDLAAIFNSQYPELQPQDFPTQQAYFDHIADRAERWDQWYRNRISRMANSTYLAVPGEVEARAVAERAAMPPGWRVKPEESLALKAQEAKERLRRTMAEVAAPPAAPVRVGFMPELRKGVEQYISPNVEEGTGLEGALGQLGSEEHRRAREFYQKVEDAFRPGAKVTPTIGDWEGTKEGSSWIHNDDDTIQEARIKAALKGLYSRQKGVALFEHAEGGPDRHYDIDFPQLDHAQVDRLIAKHGFIGSTVYESPEGLRAHLIDPGGVNSEHAKQLAAEAGSRSAEYNPGTAVLDQGDTRATAAETYRRILREGGIQTRDTDGGLPIRRYETGRESPLQSLYDEAEDNFARRQLEPEAPTVAPSEAIPAERLGAERSGPGPPEPQIPGSKVSFMPEITEPAPGKKAKKPPLVKTPPDYFRRELTPEESALLKDMQARAQAGLAQYPELPFDQAISYTTGKLTFPKKMTKAEVGAFFDGLNTQKLDFKNPEHQQLIANALTHDVLQRLQSNPESYAWYNRTIDAAMQELGQLDPRILDDPVRNLIMRCAMAITSQNQKVHPNFESSYRAYLYWDRTGQMPTDAAYFGGGTKSDAMIANFKKMNQLIAQMEKDFPGEGHARFEEALKTPKSVRQIKEEYDVKVPGEAMDYTSEASIMFGPKIGSFFNNLSKLYHTLTADLWFTRNMNRLAGRMMGFGKKALAGLDEVEAEGADDDEVPTTDPGKNQLGKLRQMINQGQLPNATKAQQRAMLKEIDAINAYRTHPDDLDRETAMSLTPTIRDWAANQHDIYQKSTGISAKTGKPLGTYGDKAPANLLAKNIDLNFQDLTDAPRNSSEREAFRQIMRNVQSNLAGLGIDITHADNQAILWYLEQDLFARAKGRKAGDFSADYLDAAYALRQKYAGQTPDEFGKVAEPPPPPEAPKPPKKGGAKKAAAMPEGPAFPLEPRRLPSPIGPPPVGQAEEEERKRAQPLAPAILAPAVPQVRRGTMMMPITGPAGVARPAAQGPQQQLQPIAAGKNPNGSDLPPRIQAVGGQDPVAFITHHDGGRETLEGIKQTLRERGLGVEYFMDRQGNIYQIGNAGAQHIKTGWGPVGTGLNNRNVVGMEVSAKDNNDVTEAQKQAFARFMAARYPNTPIYGHGEVNPGHKEAEEGQATKQAALAYREQLRRSGAPPTQQVQGGNEAKRRALEASAAQIMDSEGASSSQDGIPEIFGFRKGQDSEYPELARLRASGDEAGVRNLVKQGLAKRVIDAGSPQFSDPVIKAQLLSLAHMRGPGGARAIMNAVGGVVGTTKSETALNPQAVAKINGMSREEVLAKIERIRAKYDQHFLPDVWNRFGSGLTNRYAREHQFYGAME